MKHARFLNRSEYSVRLTSRPEKARSNGFVLALLRFGAAAADLDSAIFGLKATGSELLLIPKPGETGTVVGRFATFGTPTCPA